MSLHEKSPNFTHIATFTPDMSEEEFNREDEKLEDFFLKHKDLLTEVGNRPKKGVKIRLTIELFTEEE